MGQQYSQSYDNNYSSNNAPILSEEQIIQNSSWMSKLPNYEYICNINIPGTHQSISKYGGYCKITPAQCQSWSVTDQLKAGIRCFDIRGKLSGGKFMGYHEIICQKVLIKDIFQEIYDFLDKNTTEFIILSLQYEQYDKICHDDTLTQEFDKIINIDQIRQKYWYISTQIPQIQDIRGKIFLLCNWKYESGYMMKKCKQQHKWGAEPKEKMEAIKQFSELSNQKIAQQIKIVNECQKSQQKQNISKNLKFYINCLNAAKTTKWPLSYAKQINAYYSESCSNEGKGIVYMDFPGETLISKIITQNFSPQQK